MAGPLTKKHLPSIIKRIRELIETIQRPPHVKSPTDGAEILPSCLIRDAADKVLASLMPSGVHSKDIEDSKLPLSVLGVLLALREDLLSVLMFRENDIALSSQLHKWAGTLARTANEHKRRRQQNAPTRPTDRQAEIANAVAAHQGNQTKAANSLGISRQEVGEQLKVYITKIETLEPGIAKQFKEAIKKPQKPKTQRHAHDRNGQPFFQRTDRRRKAKPIRDDEKG